MSKYSEVPLSQAPIADLNVLVAKEMGKQLSDRCRVFDRNSAVHLAGEVEFNPVEVWEDCYPVMDALLAITTGINLKSDGTATTEINGKQESAGGGHCRAICELYLMAHDAEVKYG